MATELFLNALGRYGQASKEIWSQRQTVINMRTMWVAALEIQAGLGVPIPREVGEAYRAQIDNIDLDRIAEIERITRHDVLANIQAFNEVAGFEHIHAGFTSRDMTDQVEQMQIRQSLELVRDRCVTIFVHLADKAEMYTMMDIVGRSHFAPGQVTTVGKRFGNVAEELLQGFAHLEAYMALYAVRGVKGPMGTQADMLAKLGTPERVAEFERRYAARLGFSQVLDCVGQVYPRSLDFAAVAIVAQLASGIANLGTMIRLMAGLGLAAEGFQKGQKGSSAMPQKSTNSRTCERLFALLQVIKGCLAMLAGLLGEQWFEGDVSCSAVRRVALPDTFLAFDGMCEAVLTVLNEMQIFVEPINAELKLHLPLLSSAALLTAATDGNRETLHTVIGTYARKSADLMRAGKESTFVQDLADDPSFPLDLAQIEAIVSKPDHGLAEQQVKNVVRRIDAIIKRYPDAGDYKPKKIL